MTLRLKVRDVLGVVSADLPIEKITLVGGGNGAGKSSLLQACAAVALRAPKLRGASKKGEFGSIVRRGAGEHGGAATLEWDAGMRRMSWPAGEVHSTGDGELRSFGSPLGIGAVRFMELGPKERLSTLSERLDLAPTEQDIAEFLAPKTDDGKPGRESAEQREGRLALAKAIFDRVNTSGWDACEKNAREYALKLKGRWEEVAKPANWGPQKSAAWVPDGLLPDEPYDQAETEREMKAAQAAYQAAVKAGATNDQEIGIARGEAGLHEGLTDLAVRQQAAVAAAQTTLEALQAKLGGLPRPSDVAPRHTCPHCQGEIHATYNDTLRQVTLTAPPAEEKAKKPAAGENARRRAAITATEEAIDAAKTHLASARQMLARTNTQLVVAEEAKKRLERMLAAPRQDPAVAAEAQTAATRAETKHRLVVTMHRAREIYREWLTQQPVIACLAPAGVRAKVMEGRMSAFNADLAEMCSVGKFGPVTMSGDGEVYYGESHWDQMAESERWRADLVLTLAFAKREKASLVLVDRFDVLVPAHRAGICHMLIHAGIPALVAMSAKDEAALPALEKADYGRRAWIESGVLRLL